MKSDSSISLTKYIQSSSESATDSCCADGPLQCTVVAEDSCFKIVHKKLGCRGQNFHHH